MSNLKTIETPKSKINKLRIMVLGHSAREFASTLQHLSQSSDVKAYKTLREALNAIDKQSYDHVFVDARDEGSMSLAIPILAESKKVKNIVVLSGSRNFDALSAMPGVRSVIPKPFSPAKIVNALGLEVDKKSKSTAKKSTSQKSASKSGQASVRTKAVAPSTLVKTQSRPPQTERPKKSLQQSEKTAPKTKSENKQAAKSNILSKILGTIGFTTTIMPRLTPLLSLLYKNLALFLLASLFLAFIGYGIMIAFFLTSEGWSSPIQLQRGHELVQKADRLRNELLLKRNLVTKQLSEARNKASRGETALERAAILTQITLNTIKQEIDSREKHVTTIDDEIRELNDVLEAFNSGNTRSTEKAQLTRDFKKRIISRRVYQQSMLNLAQLDKNILGLRDAYTSKLREKEGLAQSIEFFKKLKQRLITGNKNIVLTGGVSEYSNITLQVVEVERIEASGLADLDEYEKTKDTFEHSINLLDKSLKNLRQTPMIRALDRPVNALFIPYQNMADYTKGATLYSCAVAIFWCNQVGTVGKPVEGEITTTHPFFGKPIRGQFVEANLTEKLASQKEIIHVGRPPLFF